MSNKRHAVSLQINNIALFVPLIIAIATGFLIREGQFAVVLDTQDRQEKQIQELRTQIDGLNTEISNLSRNVGNLTVHITVIENQLKSSIRSQRSINDMTLTHIERLNGIIKEVDRIRTKIEEKSKGR